MRNLMIVLSSLLIFAFSTARGALVTFSGEQSGSWDSGELSVIVGTIHDVKPGPRGYDRTASVHPKATIAGLFDPSQHSTLQVSFGVQPPSAGGTISCIREEPSDGATVLIVLLRVRAGENSKERYIIVSGICSFMPEQCGMLIVTGADDPKVAEVLKNIRKARAKANQEDAPKAAQE